METIYLRCEIKHNVLFVLVKKESNVNNVTDLMTITEKTKFS